MARGGAGSPLLQCGFQSLGARIRCPPLRWTRAQDASPCAQEAALKELSTCPLSCVLRNANTEVLMSRSTPAFALAGAICSFPILAVAQQAADGDLARFRSEYISGEGLAYVVINDAKGERLYRYGDASRLTAKKDTRGYMLFTCAAPHVFLSQKPEDKAALEKAQVVKPGDPRFAELDSKYLAGCKNPFVKSAKPKGAS
jgi:hypothetical protein